MSESQSPPPGSSQGRAPDPFVTRNRPDPGARRSSPRILQGLWGESDRPGYGRLYFTRALDVYAEFRVDDVVSTVDVPPDESPIPGEPTTRVSVGADALVDITREQRAESLSAFDIDLRIAGPISSYSLGFLSQYDPCKVGATPGDIICDSTQTCGTCYGQLTCADFGGCDSTGALLCDPVDPPVSNDLNVC